jgi:hypothetical protein
MRVLEARLSLENRHRLWQMEQHCGWLIEVADVVSKEYHHQKRSCTLLENVPDTCEEASLLKHVESKFMHVKQKEREQAHWGLTYRSSGL